MRSDLAELITEVNEVDQQKAVPLGTGLREVTHRLGMPANDLSDRMWIGEAFNGWMSVIFSFSTLSVVESSGLTVAADLLKRRAGAEVSLESSSTG